MKSKKRTLLMSLVFMFLFSILLTESIAQETARRISGTVLSSTTGDPVPGATVVVKGTKFSTVTNSKGEFTIEAEKGSVLIITSGEYEAKEVKVGSSSLNIRIEEKYRKLEDVVVIGYGRMKKTDLSSSQVSIGAKDIQKTVNTTIEQALQGRAANVYVTSNSGQPGAAPSVIIRGLSSITGSSQPLYVIDGVQIKPDNPNGGSGTSSNILSMLNPDDVETINVLQGPSATAIYGATGANGVVLITTKRGKSGQTKVSFSSLTTVNDLPALIPVMDLQEYATYRNALAAQGIIAYDPSFADPKALGKGTNWQSELLRRTMLQKYSLSMSGGTDKTTYYLGTEYFNQDGVLRGSGFKRYSIRLNLDNQPMKWLKFGTSLSVGRVQEVVNLSNGDLLNIAISQNPAIPVKNPDGSWGGPTSTQYQFTNPIALAGINDNHNKSMVFNGGINTTITPIKDLTIVNEFNTYFQYYNNYRFNPSYQFNGYVNSTTTSYRGSGNNYWWGWNQRVQYEKKLGLHFASLMAGHESTEFGYESLYGQRQNFTSNNVQELGGGAAATATNGSGKGSGAKEAYFSRLNYNYNNKYYVQASIRADGSSNFGSQNKWGYFPSVSAAWRISQENFMKSITAINDLKLRAEWGLSGNQSAVGYYASLSSIPTAWGTGYLSSNFNNDFMQWETDKSYSVGFDLYMFNNRLEVITDFYTKKIEKLLTKNSYPFYSGADDSYSPGYLQTPYENLGGMINKGFGITVNTVNIQKKLTWKTGLNFSLDRNKITYLKDSTPINASFGSLITSTRVGHPAALFTGYIAEGLFQNISEIQNHAIQTSNGVLTISPTQGTWVGDTKFKDINGDGKIDFNDRTIIGNPWPKFTFGLNNSVSWKNFDLNVFITGVYGNDVYNNVRFRNEYPGGTSPYSNYYKSVANFAKPSSVTAGDMSATLTNPGYKIPRVTAADANGNNRASNWYIEDGSYVRLKNISLAYTLPSKWASKVLMRSLKIAVNAQNLFTITKYSGYDPEIGLMPNSSSLSVGIDNARYPSVRMYTFNINAEF